MPVCHAPFSTMSSMPLRSVQWFHWDKSHVVSVPAAGPRTWMLPTQRRHLNLPQQQHNTQCCRTEINNKYHTLFHLNHCSLSTWNRKVSTIRTGCVQPNCWCVCFYTIKYRCQLSSYGTPTWVGVCIFLYWLTQVVQDKVMLNSCCCHSLSLAPVNPDWFYIPGFYLSGDSSPG